MDLVGVPRQHGQHQQGERGENVCPDNEESGRHRRGGSVVCDPQNESRELAKNRRSQDRRLPTVRVEKYSKFNKVDRTPLVPNGPRLSSPRRTLGWLLPRSLGACTSLLKWEISFRTT